MEFFNFNFDQLNESDIREEIIAPLLRHLGYRSGTPHNVVREQPLSYPKIQLGRKKKTDPILRGKADYICIAHNQIRWVIEAKSPSSDICLDDIEQAWTYANHPEIRAVYFCLSNGKELRIYQTNSGPEVAPIFECGYENLSGLLQNVYNILSPDSVKRDHPRIEIDLGKPIGPNLRSIVRVNSGKFRYTRTNPRIPPLEDLTMRVVQGAIERQENGLLTAFIETEVPFQSMQKLNEKLGFSSIELKCNAESLSDDPDNPTIFESSKLCVLPKGEKILNIMNWQEVKLPQNIESLAESRVSGILKGNLFVGEFRASITYIAQRKKVFIEGVFNVHLS